MLARIIMRTIILILLILTSSLSHVISQTKEEKKEFKKKFLEAEYFFLLEEYEEAGFLYTELLKSDPDNANLKFLAGASYLSIPGQKAKSIPYLEGAIQNISPSYREGSYKERNAPKECMFALGRAYHINYQLELAQEYYEKFKTVMQIRNVAEIEYINKQIKSIALARNMIKDTVDISINSMFDGGPGNASRYSAVYAEKDSLLIYMSRRPFYSAIMMTKLENGSWTKPETINGQIKIDGKLKLCSVSYDGKDLFISKKEHYNSELFHSEFKNGKWTKATPLPENINTIFNETHAVLSKDKNTLFFTSDKPGGFGAMDIYVAKRKAGGPWEEPENIGKPVNSIYSEETPFLTGDSKTLYFSSMSHATMGGFDIFYTNKLPSGSWSYPANLGFPISGMDDDLHYQPINNGKQAIYSGNSIFFPVNDIAIISSDSINPKSSIALKGKIVPDDNGIMEPGTQIQLLDQTTKELVAETTPVDSTGEYNFDVPVGDYELIVESSGYDTLKEDISILSQHTAKEINIENTLIPDDVASGEYVISKNILFGFDKYELSDDAKFELEKLYSIMAGNPEMMLELTGHTDSKGSANYNLRLSNNRSQAVVNYMVSRGISKERFISNAVGEKNNIAINENPDGSDNPEGRKYNRQVELKILNSGDKKFQLEEYMVPEHLKPAAHKNYYVILTDDSKEIKTANQYKLDSNIKLYETGRKHIYAAGIFANKRDAIEYLNEVIESDFPNGRIVDESEFQYLLQPSVPDLNKVKGPFTIQLHALKNPIELDQLESSSLIRQLQSTDGFYRYIVGVFDNYLIAQDSLVNYVLKGYTDAFIIPISRFDKTLDKGQLLLENYDFYYTIQFSATRKPAGKNYFEQIENIVSYKGKDGFYRYSTGIFLNKLEAEKTLQNIKGIGFKDAFIKKVSRTK